MFGWRPIMLRDEKIQFAAVLIFDASAYDHWKYPTKFWHQRDNFEYKNLRRSSVVPIFQNKLRSCIFIFTVVLLRDFIMWTNFKCEQISNDNCIMKEISMWRPYDEYATRISSCVMSGSCSFLFTSRSRAYHSFIHSFRRLEGDPLPVPDLRLLTTFILKKNYYNLADEILCREWTSQK